MDEFAYCAVTGEKHLRSEMLNYGEQWVLADHKEVFVQSLNEESLFENPSYQRGVYAGRVEFKETLRWWELKRIWFNVIVGGIGLVFSVFTIRNLSDAFSYVILAGVYGLFMNLLYCLGPMIETYLFAFRGRRLPTGRFVLFILGTVFAGMITFTMALSFSLFTPF